MRWQTDRGFDAVVTARRDEWLRLAIVLCGNRVDAEDVLQDALIALGEAWPRVHQRGVNAYLRKILVNKVIDRSRRRREAPTDVVADRVAPDSLLRFEEDQRFFATVARLPPVQRAALVCRYYLDLPDRQTAELLLCAQDTVRSHIRRGLSTLREAMSEDELRGAKS